ncbi:MAG TPA: LPS assembly protein LptD [Candidatus Binatia bacterium]|nr:LPS assembly protein LptD [Candidatus Binatia bacterium]
MIPRTRLIITALLLCHLFLRPPVVTSQLRAGAQQQNPSPATSEPAGLDTGSSAAAQNASRVWAQAQNPQTKPEVTATTDSGEEDTTTERIIRQELQNSNEQELGPTRPATNVALGRNEVLIRADEQEKKQDIYYVRGHVEIRFRGDVLHADQATYDSSTGQVTATGHVVFDGATRNVHLAGSHATYDVSRDTGTFYDATGSTGARVKNKTMFLTSSTPFFFTGKIVDKLGPDQYRVHQGYVTSCQLPKPKWQLQSKVANVEVGDEAQLHHATLKLGGVPVFYFPYMEHPVDNLGRKSGFLIPEIGTSTTRGTVLGDGFYWVLSRNADATLGAALYSARGWAQFGDLRVIGYSYGLQAQYYGVVDENGAPHTHQNQGGQELKVNAGKQFSNGFQGVLSVDYLSSYIFRLAFGLAFTEAINSEVRSYGFLSRSWNGYGFGFLASQYQNYESTTPGDYIEIVHAPSLELSTVERPFSRSGFVYAFDTAAEGLSRSEIGFRTAPIVGRADVAPYIAWPKLFRGWTFRPQIGARETYYSQRLVPGPTATGAIAVSDAINRNVANASFEVRPPTLSRVFNRKPFGRAVKHTIEPFAIYRYQTGISDFAQIIRFDYRDILANTNEVEYGVVNRLYVKKTSLSAKCFQHPGNSPPSESPGERGGNARPAECNDQSAPAGDVVSWELAQKYFGNSNFGGALVTGRRNVFDTTVDLTGIAFLTAPRLFSPIVSRLRIQSGAADFQWALDYDPVLDHVNASTLFAGYRWGNWYLNGGQSYVNAPGEFSLSSNGTETPAIFNQYRIGLTYGAMSKPGLSSAFTVGVDSRLSYIQTATIQTNYNWDCCGIAFQYQRWALGFVRNENAYRFSFSLTNVGTFGSIRRLQRLY